MAVFAMRIGVLAGLRQLDTGFCAISCQFTTLVASLHSAAVDAQHEWHAPSGLSQPRCRNPHYQRQQQQQQCQPQPHHPWAVPHHRAAYLNAAQLQPCIGGACSDSFHSSSQQRWAWANRRYHNLQQQQPPSIPPQQQQQQQGDRVAGSSITSLPNLLSLSRVVSGPWVVWLILDQQWALAVTLTAAAGVTDWADGFLARKLSHTSKLGSYLDPLADKIFIGCIVGTMGLQGLLPAWLAAMVVGRDAAQVAGTAAHRLRMFGGRWPGAATFFDVDSGGSAASSGSGGGLPAVRPLLVSKANTVLVLLLVAGCMTQQWQGLPGQGLLDVLEVAAAATTSASAVAYAWLHHKGQLLVDSSSSGSKDSGSSGGSMPNGS